MRGWHTLQGLASGVLRVAPRQWACAVGRCGGACCWTRRWTTAAGFVKSRPLAAAPARCGVVFFSATDRAISAAIAAWLSPSLSPPLSPPHGDAVAAATAGTSSVSTASAIGAAAAAAVAADLTAAESLAAGTASYAAVSAAAVAVAAAAAAAVVSYHGSVSSRHPLPTARARRVGRALVGGAAMTWMLLARRHDAAFAVGTPVAICIWRPSAGRDEFAGCGRSHGTTACRSVHHCFHTRRSRRARLPLSCPFLGLFISGCPSPPLGC